MNDASPTEKTLAEILVAFLNHNSISPAELPSLVRQVRAALLDRPALNERPTETNVEPMRPAEEIEARPRPAVPIDQSVKWDHLVSLEDGKHYRSLRRHLMSKYGMTPEDYRQKWGLPADYPMVAPSYAQDRSSVAKRIGLGKSANKGAQSRVKS